MFTKMLSTSALMLLLAHAAESTESWQACLQMSDDQARLSCYDAYARKLSTRDEPPVKTAEQKEAEFGKRPAADEAEPVKPAAQQETEFGKPPKIEAQDLDQIQAGISKVQVKRHGNRVLTLDNGQVWVQIDSRTAPRFKEGDSIIIKRAVFGSFLLKPVDSNRTIRVKRMH